MKFVRHPERSKHHGAVFAQSNFQKRSTNRTFLKGKGAQRPFEDLATSFDGSCGKCNFAHESYCMSLLDPAAADALRFCSFTSLHLAKLRLRATPFAQDDT